MLKPRWADPGFLDELRSLGDELADDCVERLRQEGNRSDFSALFRRMTSSAEPLPLDLPDSLREFLDRTHRLPRLEASGERHPAGVDLDRIRRGGSVFLLHACPSALVLLAKSLPEGYAAPPLSRILSLSGNLDHHPFRRLAGVLQMLVSISSGGGFSPGGSAIVIAQKMRLLHAGIRRIASHELPLFEARFGRPANLEDMLATIMGFSLLQIRGLRLLGIGISREEAEDHYYLWRVFAQMCGIHPPGEPDNPAFIPADLTEASEFYRAYAKRHYVGADQNPQGVRLADSNLRLLESLLPRTPLRRFGWKIVPRIYVQHLCGIAACRRVGIRPVHGLVLTRWLLLRLPVLWSRLFGGLDRMDRTGSIHERLSRALFGRIVKEADDGVGFLLPADLADLRKMVGDPPGGKAGSSS